MVFFVLRWFEESGFPFGLRSNAARRGIPVIFWVQIIERLMELFIAMRKPSFSGVRLSVELLESRELLNADLTGNLVLGFKPGTVAAFTESSKIAVAEGA